MDAFLLDDFREMLDWKKESFIDMELLSYPMKSGRYNE